MSEKGSDLAEILQSVGLPHAPDDGRHDRLRSALGFSNALARLVADRLRPTFPGVKPGPDGSGQESVARSAKGYKKLDVNYSTPELGLGLGLSLKTVNSVDPKTGRYDHNYSRIDNELVTEATDYHKRQPYAVLVAVLFLPIGSCVTGAVRKQYGIWVSDFARAVVYFRNRAARARHTDDPDRFERFFVALYDDRPGEPTFGDVRFFDVLDDVPNDREVTEGEGISTDSFIEEVVKTYDERNNPPVAWRE